MGLEGERVLYVSYNGMLDPLGQSQVIPYLRELARKGVRFTILSFERERAWTSEGKEKCAELSRSLSQDGIEWHWLKYHKRPSLPATVYDVFAGIRKASELIQLRQISMVHARSHIPATIALSMKRRHNTKFIFDVRGLMAEEYVDAGHWKKNSLPFLLTKKMERNAFAAADGLVTLTNRIWPIIREWDGLRNRSVAHEVVPCCADLNRFQFNVAEREAVRSRLGLTGRFVVVYSGSIGGWYMTDEMADFFAAVLQDQADVHALWLTPSGHETVRSLMRARGVSDERYTVIAAESQEVSSYLSAADAGLAFIKPCFSKLASSPTKNAEYLACGLSLIINANVGDSDALITEEGVGQLLKEHSRESYVSTLMKLRAQTRNLEETRRHSRSVAERLFNVSGVGLERYSRLYNKVLNDRPAGSISPKLRRDAADDLMPKADFEP